MASTRLTDRVIAHALRLPAPSTGYGVSEGLRVPMRDGAELIADHYRPHTASPRGTVLVRGPYGRSLPFALIYARIYAARGYHVLLQSVRGTFGSGGTFVPMVHEVDDAADTVAWFEQRRVRLKTEADGRLFPDTDDSQTIIDCLLAEAKGAVRRPTGRV